MACHTRLLLSAVTGYSKTMACPTRLLLSAVTGHLKTMACPTRLLLSAVTGHSKSDGLSHKTAPERGDRPLENDGLSSSGGSHKDGCGQNLTAPRHFVTS